jgi:hypothetical protein
MYGGLFGDLPAAKKASSSSHHHQDAEEQSGGDNKPINTDDTNNVAAGPLPLSPGISKDESFLPHAASKRPKMDSAGAFAASAARAASATTQSLQQQPHSILQTVGKAGTSMAFVPTALKRKKASRFSKALEVPKIVEPANSDNHNNNNSSSSTINNFVSTATPQQNETNSRPSEEGLTATAVSSNFFSAFEPHEMAVTTTIVRASSKQPQSTIVDIHQDNSGTAAPTGTGVSMPTNESTTCLPLDHHHNNHTSAGMSAIEITDPYGTKDFRFLRLQVMVTTTPSSN